MLGIDPLKRKDGPPPSPATIKKRRVLEEKSTNIGSTPPMLRGAKMGSQPVKSSFEEDLDRLTQEIDQVGDCTTPNTLPLVFLSGRPLTCAFFPPADMRTYSSTV